MARVYVLDSKALLKILLHAAKHPSHAVNGVLLGTAEAAQPGSPQEGAALPAVTLVDAVPLFHSFLSVAPALEAALFQVALLAPRARSLLLIEASTMCQAAVQPGQTGSTRVWTGCNAYTATCACRSTHTPGNAAWR